MNRNIAGLLTVILTLHSLIHAAYQIEGIVLDQTTGQTIPDANILVLNTSSGAASQQDGFFSLPRLDAGEYTLEIKVMGYSGLTVKFCHTVGAQVIVRGLRVFSDFEYEFRMALANHRLAPDIELMALITAEQHTFLSSSTVREIAALEGDVSSMVPPHVDKALSTRFHELGEEQDLVPSTSLRD